MYADTVLITEHIIFEVFLDLIDCYAYKFSITCLHDLCGYSTWFCFAVVLIFVVALLYNILICVLYGFALTCCWHHELICTQNEEMNKLCLYRSWVTYAVGQCRRNNVFVTCTKSRIHLILNFLIISTAGICDYDYKELQYDYNIDFVFQRHTWETSMLIANMQVAKIVHLSCVCLQLYCCCLLNCNV